MDHQNIKAPNDGFLDAASHFWHNSPSILKSLPVSQTDCLQQIKNWRHAKCKKQSLIWD